MPKLSFLTVLRSGGDFTLEHVYAMRRMMREHCPDPDVAFRCLTDREFSPAISSIPLRYDWRGWWAKMEMFRPDLRGPIFYTDLDAVIVGDLAPFFEDLSTSVILRDFYRGRRDPRAMQSALMLLTEEDRAHVWSAWSKDPAKWMRLRGDQNVLEKLLTGRVRYWQDLLPNAVVSYKSHVKRRGIPIGARIVAFHGNPRPWTAKDEWAREAFRPRMKVESLEREAVV